MHVKLLLFVSLYTYMCINVNVRMFVQMRCKAEIWQASRETTETNHWRERHVWLTVCHFLPTRVGGWTHYATLLMCLSAVWSVNCFHHTLQGRATTYGNSVYRFIRSWKYFTNEILWFSSVLWLEYSSRTGSQEILSLLRNLYFITVYTSLATRLYDELHKSVLHPYVFFTLILILSSHVRQGHQNNISTNGKIFSFIQICKAVSNQLGACAVRTAFECSFAT
jgi:hypothetical protein